VLAPDLSGDRVRLIEDVGKKWVNGTKLRYYFFSDGAWEGGNDQQDIVRKGFDVWKEVGIGLDFEETTSISEAEVRIGFLRGDGSWSYIGRDILSQAGPAERTMNFGWDLRTDPRGVDVPVHEIGHTLGFPHEHQNPFSGIVWNEQAVYEYFGQPPNSWPRDTTFNNILRKLSPNEVQGTNWDPDSIMHYAFATGLIQKPDQFALGLTPHGGLSESDRDQALRFYPHQDADAFSELAPFQSEKLSLGEAEQKDFVIEPSSTRDYVVQLFGGADAVMVLFEDQEGDLKYVKGDDDSGTPRNARLDVRLQKGRRYVLRIRNYVNYGGESAVMIW
jgi:hypothetical protein